MKVIRYTLLILLSLVLLNLVTYFTIGKQSLRERNVSEMMNTNLYLADHTNSVFPLISNLNLDSKHKLNGYEYPVFSLREYYDENGLVKKYSDSILNMNHILIEKDKVESILNINFELFDDSEIDSLLAKNFENLLRKIQDSLSLNLKNESLKGDCTYHKTIRCRTYNKWSNFLFEEIKAENLFYTHQYLEFKLFPDHVSSYREEKLIWLFYRWVQIDWIDGNGLGGDTTK